MCSQRNNRPICISVINMKGGVGKSTISALLGRYALWHLQLNVLTIDLDPQANLSQAYMRRGYRQFLAERLPSIVEVFSEYRPPSRGRSSPSPLAVEDVVVDIHTRHSSKLQLIPSRFDFSDHLIQSATPNPQILARFLSDNFQDTDLIIIDCAPTESVFTQAAYHASGHVLVPVRPEFFATIGFPLLEQSLEQFRINNRGHEIDIAGVVINNATYSSGNAGGPERRRSLSEIRAEASRNGWHIFRHEIPFSRGFPKMMRGDYNHLGNAWRFNRFAEELLSRLGFETDERQ